MEEILSQPKQKELAGSVRQKMLLDYSVYMGRCVPQENRSPHRSPVQSVESSPTAGKKVKLSTLVELPSPLLVLLSACETLLVLCLFEALGTQ